MSPNFCELIFELCRSINLHENNLRLNEARFRDRMRARSAKRYCESTAGAVKFDASFDSRMIAPLFSESNTSSSNFSGQFARNLRPRAEIQARDSVTLVAKLFSNENRKSDSYEFITSCWPRGRICSDAHRLVCLRIRNSLVVANNRYIFVDI